MATVTRKRTRGRKKGQLRIEAATIAASVAAEPGAETAVTLEVVSAAGRKKAESITVEFPKGTVGIPVALTTDKSEENAREQLRLAAGDAGRKLSIRSVEYVTDASVQGIAWFYVPVASAKATPAKAAPKRKPKGK